MIRDNIDRDELHRRVARQLATMAVETEAVGALICGDAALCIRFHKELQAIDRLAQWQRSISAILLAKTVEQAWDACSMDEVAHLLSGHFDGSSGSQSGASEDSGRTDDEADAPLGVSRARQ